MNRSQIESLETRQLFATYTPDVTFGNDGTLTRLEPTLPTVAVRDGGIVFSGLSPDESSGPRFNVYRSHADGTPDREFGTRTIAVGTDATRLKLVGADALSRPYLAASYRDMAYIARLRKDGSPDRSFTALVNPPHSSMQSTTVDQVQPLPGGGFLVVTHVKLRNSVETYVGKFDEGGRLDLEFGLGSSGYALLVESRPGDTTPPAVWLQADSKGRIYFTAGQPGVSRLRANGSLDKGFDGNGSTGDFAVDPAAALDADGRLVLLDPAMRTIRRFDTTGRDDLTFDGDGQGPPVLTPNPSEPIGVFPQADGLIYAQAGRTVARFKADGTLDTRFDSDGLARLPTAGQILAILPGGQFLQRYGDEVKAVARLKNVALGRSGVLYVTGEAAADTVDIRTTSRAVNVTFGSDTFTYKKSAVSRISANLGRGNNGFTSTAALPTTVVTADGYDRVTTGNADDTIYTGGSSDRIFSFGGNDRLYPGAGNNTVDGGDGNDVCVGESKSDLLSNIEESSYTVFA